MSLTFRVLRGARIPAPIAGTASFEDFERTPLGPLLSPYIQYPDRYRVAIRPGRTHQGEPDDTWLEVTIHVLVRDPKTREILRSGVQRRMRSSLDVHVEAFTPPPDPTRAAVPKKRTRVRQAPDRGASHVAYDSVTLPPLQVSMKLRAHGYPELPFGSEATMIVGHPIYLAVPAPGGCSVYGLVVDTGVVGLCAWHNRMLLRADTFNYFRTPQGHSAIDDLDREYVPVQCERTQKIQAALVKLYAYRYRVFGDEKGTPETLRTVSPEGPAGPWAWYIRRPKQFFISIRPDTGSHVKVTVEFLDAELKKRGENVNRFCGTVNRLKHKPKVVRAPYVREFAITPLALFRYTRGMRT